MSFGYDFTCTYWVATQSDDGDPFTASTPTWQRYTTKCEHQSANETKKDDSGAEFMPSSLFYTLAAIPKGARIAFGDVPDLSPPASAETVRSVDEGTGFIGDPIEYVVATA